MNESIKPTDHASRWARIPALYVLIGLTLALLALFRDGLYQMWTVWAREEYNHAYLIPFVALYLFALKASALQEAGRRSSWAGVWAVALGIVMLLLGDLSAVYTITQYGFLVTVWGLLLAAIGWRGVGLVWVSLVYLIFMIPLPNFIFFNLSASLQLVSSQLGVAVIRAFRVPVFLEGNVIDLGVLQLQVAEACSGLRYLFPLMSFGFLCAALFRGRWWQRAIIFLSTIPITVLMNSFRVGMIGLLVDRYGITQAEGFLHYFEGWVVFMACVGILFVEMLLFAAMSRQRMADVFAVDMPSIGDFTGLLRAGRLSRPVLAASLGILVALGVSLFLQRPLELVPERATLRTFPLALGDWHGREQGVQDVYLEELKPTDYLSADYQRPQELPVDLWVVYYDSQRSGASVHSPRACLPGGGWRMEVFEDHEIPDVGPAGQALSVNRAVISMGNSRQLVYYWFVQQGRIVTNEYLVKWYIFWDALTRSRTDGALVRLVTPVPDGTDIAAADQRLAAFIRAIDPKLSYFLPQQSAVLRQAQAAR